MGLLLGWTALPALFVALVLQAVFFGYGGFAVLGVNTLNMALPALLCALALRPLLRRERQRPEARPVFRIGAAAGAAGVLLTALMLALSLGLSGQAFIPAAQVLVITYVPLALVEALITGTVLRFLQRVEPDLLPGPRALEVEALP
jgi:cobalt/nickel transport system permease protein